MQGWRVSQVNDYYYLLVNNAAASLRSMLELQLNVNVLKHLTVGYHFNFAVNVSMNDCLS